MFNRWCSTDIFNSYIGSHFLVSGQLFNELRYVSDQIWSLVYLKRCLSGFQRGVRSDSRTMSTFSYHTAKRISVTHLCELFIRNLPLFIDNIESRIEYPQRKARQYQTDERENYR